jgi:hypothetical protein
MFSLPFFPLIRRGAMVVAAALALSSVAAIAQPLRDVDLATEPLARLAPGMTSANMLIFGVRLGMHWQEARTILDMQRMDYLYQKGIPSRVLVRGLRSTYYFILNPSSFEIVEMGIMDPRDLPLENQYLADGRRWRLTTARTHFFRGEGDYVRNEEGENIVYDQLGFVLKWLLNGEFRFVMVWKRPPPAPRCDADMRFFLNAYYFPNTTAGLARLEQRLKGPLARATYLRITPEDRRQAAFVDLAMAELLACLRQMCDWFLQKNGGSRTELTIRITGYTSAAPFLVGAYYDDPVDIKADDMQRAFGIVTGGPLGDAGDPTQGNFRLGMLRAFWTARVLERQMRATSANWRLLENSGRIRWIYDSGTVRSDVPDAKDQRSILLEAVVD